VALEIRDWLSDASVVHDDATTPHARRPSHRASADSHEWLIDVASECVAAGMEVTASRRSAFADVVRACLSDTGERIPRDLYRTLRLVAAATTQRRSVQKAPRRP
jgi:hypothetical protein